MTQPMLCGYCLDRLTWPDDFPVRTEAVCRRCGERMYGWERITSAAHETPVATRDQGQ